MIRIVLMAVFTHVALQVEDLRAAEAYYAQLFGLVVVFREAPVDGVWKTFRTLDAWDAPGVPSPQMASLAADGFHLALNKSDEGVPQRGPVDHIGLAVYQDDLVEMRRRASELNCTINAQRADLLVFTDANGIQWELSSAAEPLASNGDRWGRWID